MRKMFLLTPLLFAQTLNANNLVCTLIAQCHFVKNYTKKEKSFFSSDTDYKTGQDIRIPNTNGRKIYTRTKNKIGGDFQAVKMESCFKSALELAETLKDVKSSDIGGESEEVVCKSFVKWSFIDLTIESFKEGKVSTETRKTLLDAYNSNPKSLALKIEGDNRFYSSPNESGENQSLPFEGKAFSPQIIE